MNDRPDEFESKSGSLSAQLRRSDVALASVGTDAYADPARVDSGVRTLGDALGWSTPESALGALVPTGARVLIKPNWVLHRNDGPGGFEPLVTHASVLQAIARAALATSLSELRIGDAPVQSCDFAALLSRAGMDTWADETSRRDERFRGLVDFRRTISSINGEIRHATEGVRGLESYVLFDLGADSYLEEVTDRSGRFRVTMYPPALMQRTHAPGRHQYLVAREILEAHLVINAPKLKTHRKAGVTCALKNLVGINGNKEYLPHHRIGSPAHGGDCYPEESAVKRSLERVLDLRNATESPSGQRVLGVMARGLQSVAHRMGDVVGVEGAWSGNDTVWRMCLDLNRIILYGRPDGTIAETPQRRVISITDAVIAGQGDGPLAPMPLPLGLLLGADSSAATDLVGARLLGYDAARIPISRHAFDPSPWPLAAFGPDEVTIIRDGVRMALSIVPLPSPGTVNHPPGWRDAAAGALA